MRLTLLVVVALIATLATPVVAHAQAARAAAAAADLPEPALAELTASLPPSPIIVFAMDHEQLAEMAAASVPTRGQDALVADTFRALAWLLWAEEGGDRTGVDLPLASGAAIGMYPPSGEVVIATSRRAMRGRIGDGAEPESVGSHWTPMLAARRGDRILVATADRMDAALDPARPDWSLVAEWPEIADVWTDDAAFRLYIDGAELVRTARHGGGAVRIFRDRGIRRVAIAVHADASIHIAVDGTDPSVMSEALGAAQSFTTASLEQAAGLDVVGDVLQLAVDGILSRVELDTTASPMRATIAAPTCGGLLQQMSSAALLVLLAERGGPDTPPVAAFEPIVDPPVLDRCRTTDEVAAATLTLDPLRALALPSEGAVGMTFDLAAVARLVTVDGGGLLPFALDPARVEAAFADRGLSLAAPLPLTMVALGDGPVDHGGVWVRVPTALDGLLSPLRLRYSTADGDTRVFGSDHDRAPSLDGPDVPSWMAAIDTTQPGAIVVTGEVFAELANELPFPFRGPWVQAFASSNAVVVSIDDEGRPTITIASDASTPEEAALLPELFSTGLQGVLQLGAMEMSVGARGVQSLTQLGERIGALGRGDVVDGGVRFTLDVDGQWIVLAGIGAASAVLPWLHEEYYDSARWQVENGMREIITAARTHWDNDPDGDGVRAYPPSIGPTPALEDLTSLCAPVPAGRHGWSMSMAEAAMADSGAFDADASTWDQLGFDPAATPWVAWSFTSSGTETNAEMRVTAWVDADCDGEYAEFVWQSDPAWHGTPRPWPGSADAPIEITNPFE